MESARHGHVKIMRNAGAWTVTAQEVLAVATSHVRTRWKIGLVGGHAHTKSGKGDLYPI